MHLKSIGALCARQLSYEACEFELVEGVGDERIRRVYNKGMTLLRFVPLPAKSFTQHNLSFNGNSNGAVDGLAVAACEQIEPVRSKGGDGRSHGGDVEGEPCEEMRHHIALHEESDSEDDDIKEAKTETEK